MQLGPLRRGDVPMRCPDHDTAADTAVSRERIDNSNILTALNTDVHLHVMSFLPAVNLSSLLRTCRHFLEIGTPSLCLQAGNEPIESAQHTLSFRDFLRVGTPESRDSHVVSLWFRLPERSGFDTRTSTSQRPEHWNAVLTILYNCRGLRSLRIDTWDIRIDPIIVLNAALTSLKSLEDLSIALTPDLAEELLRLSLIGLRRLSIQWPKSERSLDLRRTILWSIRPLAKTLVELNNVIPRDVKTRFSLVHTLGLAMDRSATLIHDAVRTFPNVTRLTLHSAHHHRCHWDREGPAEDNAYRKENKSRWSLDYPRAWPSLTAMWAEDLCGAYCLGMVRSVRAMSLPLTLDSRFYMLPTIVAEMQPRFLELRVDLDDPRICTGILDRLRMPNWSWLSDPANASLSHLTLVMEGLDRVPVYATYHTEAKLVLEGFALALRNAFLTHLLLRYPGRQDVEAISADALLCVTRLAKASPTLCWIGVETIAAGLLCWDVSRTQVAGETDQDQAMDTTLVKMHGEMGARVLEREGIDQFRYVRL